MLGAATGGAAVPAGAATAAVTGAAAAATPVGGCPATVTGGAPAVARAAAVACSADTVAGGTAAAVTSVVTWSLEDDVTDGAASLRWVAFSPRPASVFFFVVSPATGAAGAKAHTAPSAAGSAMPANPLNFAGLSALTGAGCDVAKCDSRPNGTVAPDCGTPPSTGDADPDAAMTALGPAPLPWSRPSGAIKADVVA
jgi:hypothetical protein